MRQQGESINAIAAKIGLAKSTVSLWVRKVDLPAEIKLDLKDRQLKFWKQGHAAIRRRRLFDQQERQKSTALVIQRILKKPSKDLFQLFTALLYWCEGAKNASALKFANSDPRLVESFLETLRKGFTINESKLRALVHLHEYHDERKQLSYWSNLTKIPLKQFHKSYLKPNTGKRKKSDYPGCITIYYGKATLVLELESLYYTFAHHLKGG